MSARLVINIRKIAENTRKIVTLCDKYNIEVLGVTKGFSANPRIVDAMLEGGIRSLADSRLENISSLRKHGYKQHMTLLRIPGLSDADKVVEYTDCSLNSEYVVIKALSDAAVDMNKVHDIVLMVDVGDRREGVLPEEVKSIAEKILMLPGVRLAGVGTNMGCYGGILPTLDNLNLLISLKSMVEDTFGIPIEITSGGGTSSLELIRRGEMPKGINQLRIGEGILLGTDTTHNKPIPELSQDAFVLLAEILEIKEKSSVPVGEMGYDAFGNQPVFEDKGIRKRAIIGLGKQDVNIDGLIPVDENIKILGASSDHMIVDVTDSENTFTVGGRIPFRLNYQGLLFLNNSKYVKKVYV